MTVNSAAMLADPVAYVSSLSADDLPLVASDAAHLLGRKEYEDAHPCRGEYLSGVRYIAPCGTGYSGASQWARAHRLLMLRLRLQPNGKHRHTCEAMGAWLAYSSGQKSAAADLYPDRHAEHLACLAAHFAQRAADDQRLLADWGN